MRKSPLIWKGFAVAIILLFVSIAIFPMEGFSAYRDDNIPPVTTISYSPSEPDGENGWYVSNVTVILNATDDLSGVNITKYRINGTLWQTYAEPFLLNKDGHDILIEFFSIDNAGNIEPVKNTTLDIDRTKPIIFGLNLSWEGNRWRGYNITVHANVSDVMSGMNRVEFYKNDVLQETVTDPGPLYEWVFHYPLFYAFNVRGFIRSPEITDEYVKFYSIIVIISGLTKERIPKLAIYVYDNAGNWDWKEFPQPSPVVNISGGIYLFQNVTLPNDYTGYIGRNLIYARFNNG